MRFIRVASLFAGVALLLTGVADVIGRRAELRVARERTFETSTELAAARVDAGIARIAAVLAIAPEGTDVETLADTLGVTICALAPGVEVASGARCAPAVPGALDPQLVGRALAASSTLDGPAAVVDSATDETTTVVVAVARFAGDFYASVTLDALVDSASDSPLRIVVEEAGRTDGVTLRRGSERVVTVALETEFVGGVRSLRAVDSTPITLSGDERALISAQLLIGGVLLLLAVGSLVNEHRALHRRATVDDLTGLPNRAEFERRAAATLARLRRTGTGACVMVVDLDQFKSINDSAGHHVGDRVLAAAGAQLRAVVRASDLVGRWGGDEFVVLLEGVGDRDAVAARARSIEAALASSAVVVELDGRQPVAMTASVGAALFPDHGQDLDTLLRAADGAMYAAKAGGIRHQLAG